MKIAITQRQVSINNFVYDCLEQGWYDLFSKHEIIPIPNLGNVDIEVDMLVLSGGETTESRYQTEFSCCAWAAQHRIPILGVCHGAFFLNHLYNGKNVNTVGHHNTEHLIRLEGRDYTVNSYHRIQIDELGDDLNPIAQCDAVVEGFKHKNLDVWGVVWHPERMKVPVLPSELRELIND